MKRNYIAYCLFAATVLVWLPCLTGEYLRDDLEIIVNNPDLTNIHSFKDCFLFTVKPAKPVSNFLIAFAHWAGRGSVEAHRFISVVLHGAVVMFLYLNALHLGRVLAVSAIGRVAFWTSLLFAISPIHSETLTVAWFRMDMLGAFFTLIAMLLVQKIPTAAKRSVRIFLLVGIFLTVGLAQLSKEVFAIIAPLSVFFLYLAVSARSNKIPPNHDRLWFFRFIGLTECFWGGLLFLLLQIDVEPRFSYAGIIGTGVLGISQQVWLAGWSVLESLAKIFTASGVTTAPLFLRPGEPTVLSTFASVTGLAGSSVAVFFLFRLGGWWRTWGLLLGTSVLVYLVIPNVNLGAERYWYFPAMALCAIFVLAFSLFCQRYVYKVAWISSAVLAVYALLIIANLEMRIFDLKTRLRHYVSEWEARPNLASTWFNVGKAMMEHDSTLTQAWSFIQKAKEMQMDSKSIALAEFEYFLKVKDIKAIESNLPSYLKFFSSDTETQSLFYYFFGQLKGESGLCSEALELFQKALHLNPKSPIYQRALAAAEHGVMSSDGGCSANAGGGMH